VISSNIQAEQSTYSFGIVPQQSATKMVRLWGPVLAKISKKSGVKLKFRTAKNIPTFETEVLAGSYDFSYMNPYHYVIFNQHPKYQAISRAKDKKIQGIVVVRKDSPIESLDELHEQPVAFPAAASFAATLLPYAHMCVQGIFYQPTYVKSHDSVYRAVAKGVFVAGGGVQRTLNSLEPEIREQLKVFWKSEKFTPHAIAYHPRVPSEIHEKVQGAMIELSDDQEFLDLLSKLRMKGFVEAHDSDWDDVRKLNITILNGLIAPFVTKIPSQSFPSNSDDQTSLSVSPTSRYS
jgi:phosphonate transport system substrate-binding protein